MEPKLNKHTDNGNAHEGISPAMNLGQREDGNSAQDCVSRTPPGTLIVTSSSAQCCGPIQEEKQDKHTKPKGNVGNQNRSHFPGHPQVEKSTRTMNSGQVDQTLSTANQCLPSPRPTRKPSQNTRSARSAGTQILHQQPIPRDVSTQSLYPQSPSTKAEERKSQVLLSKDEGKAVTSWSNQVCHMTNVDKHTRIIIVGNPGVGKSMIQNSLLGKPVFKSGISLGEGLTKRISSYDMGNKSFIDTPGLDDIYHRSTAAREISAALRGPAAVKVVFVATLESGRVRSADICTLQTILKALREVVGDMRNRYGLIINKCEPSVAQQLRNGHSLELRTSVFGPFHAVEEMKHVEVIGFDGAVQGKSGKLLKTEEREHVQKMIECIPVIHLPPEPPVRLDVATYEEETQQIDEEMIRFYKDFERSTNGSSYWTDGNGSRVDYPQPHLMDDRSRFRTRMRQYSNRTGPINWVFDLFGHWVLGFLHGVQAGGMPHNGV